MKEFTFWTAKAQSRSCLKTWNVFDEIIRINVRISWSICKCGLRE